MEPRSLHLAGHDDPVADVGRDISARISHVSALLQQLALRGRFAGGGFPAAGGEAAAPNLISEQVVRCGNCGSRPCQCAVETREQLKSEFVDGQNATVDAEGPHGRLVSADELARDAVKVFDHHQQHQWAEQLRHELAPSVATAGEILADTSADSAAVLAAARVVVWDTQLAADAARHSEAVVQAAERWADWDATDRWAQYLPDEADLATATEVKHQTWLDQQLAEVVPALQRGDAATALTGAHAAMDTGLRTVVTAHNVEQDESGYHRAETRLGGDRAHEQAVEDDIDDHIAYIAAWRQRAAAEDRDPHTVPTQLNDAATAKARQTRAYARLVDSDGDLKEAAGHEATVHEAPDPREPQPIRPVINHLLDQPESAPLDGDRAGAGLAGEPSGVPFKR